MQKHCHYYHYCGRMHVCNPGESHTQTLDMATQLCYRYWDSDTTRLQTMNESWRKICTDLQPSFEFARGWKTFSLKLALFPLLFSSKMLFTSLPAILGPNVGVVGLTHWVRIHATIKASKYPGQDLPTGICYFNLFIWTPIILTQTIELKNSRDQKSG